MNITAQADILWPYLTIEEHFQVISLVQGSDSYENRFKAISARLELDKPYKYPAILSGGNKRKLCTALTLLTTPELAFFDEPTVGLDPIARRNLLDLIKKGGASVLFTTHRLDEAEYLCNRVAIMKHGRVLFDGDIEDVKDSYLQDGKEGKRCHGLVLLREPRGDIKTLMPFLEVEQTDQD